MRFLLVLVALGFFGASVSAGPTKDQWRGDLDTLAENLLERHPNFFTTHTVEEFEDAIEELAAKIDTLDDAQIVIELSRLIALGGDPHTSIELSPYAKAMHRLPIQVIVLSDGVFISAATAPY